MKFSTARQMIPVLVLFLPVSARAEGAAAKRAPIAEPVPLNLAQPPTDTALAVNTRIPASAIQNLPGIRPLAVKPLVEAGIKTQLATLPMNGAIPIESLAPPRTRSSDGEDLSPYAQIEGMKQAGENMPKNSFAEETAGAGARQFGEENFATRDSNENAVLSPLASAEPETRLGKDTPETVQLIRLTQNGDHQSFEALHKLYKKQIYSVAFKMLGNREEAEDVTQETFLNLYKSIGTFEFKSQLRTFLTRIAINKVLERRRKLEFGKNVSLDEKLSPLSDSNWGIYNAPPQIIENA